ncbi:MAG: hypothetical protein LBL41_05090 [Bifidobacteriaceae bacterium]|nr:hypothetical protein [Bifidobacteriaceae bacterium]
MTLIISLKSKITGLKILRPNIMSAQNVGIHVFVPPTYTLELFKVSTI